MFKIQFCLLKHNILVEMDIRGIINCVTFSVAPSIINDKQKEHINPFSSIIVATLSQIE